MLLDTTGYTKARKRKTGRDNKVIGKNENEDQAKRNAEAEKKVLGFRKQWSALHDALQLHCTYFVKHFHMIALLLSALFYKRTKIIMKILAYRKE